MFVRLSAGSCACLTVIFVHIWLQVYSTFLTAHCSSCRQQLVSIIIVQLIWGPFKINQIFQLIYRIIPLIYKRTDMVVLNCIWFTVLTSNQPIFSHPDAWPSESETIFSCACCCVDRYQGKSVDILGRLTTGRVTRGIFIPDHNSGLPDFMRRFLTGWFLRSVLKWYGPVSVFSS